MEVGWDRRRLARQRSSARFARRQRSRAGLGIGRTRFCSTLGAGRWGRSYRSVWITRMMDGLDPEGVEIDRVPRGVVSRTGRARMDRCRGDDLQEPWPLAQIGATPRVRSRDHAGANGSERWWSASGPLDGCLGSGRVAGRARRSCSAACSGASLGHEYLRIHPCRRRQARVPSPLSHRLRGILPGKTPRMHRSCSASVPTSDPSTRSPTRCSPPSCRCPQAPWGKKGCDDRSVWGFAGDVLCRSNAEVKPCQCGRSP